MRKVYSQVYKFKGAQKTIIFPFSNPRIHSLKHRRVLLMFFFRFPSGIAVKIYLAIHWMTLPGIPLEISSGISTDIPLLISLGTLVSFRYSCRDSFSNYTGFLKKKICCISAKDSFRDFIKNSSRRFFIFFLQIYFVVFFLYFLGISSTIFHDFFPGSYPGFLHWSFPGFLYGFLLGSFRFASRILSRIFPNLFFLEFHQEFLPVAVLSLIPLRINLI